MLDKKLLAAILIAIIALVIAVVALSESYVIISEYHKATSSSSTSTLSPQSTLYQTITPQPPLAPAATPNLSLATRNNNQTIMVNSTYQDYTNFIQGLEVVWTLNVTDASKSDITIVTITYVGNYNNTGTYLGSYPKVLSPDATATFVWSDPPEFTSITVYYQVADQLYYRTVNGG